MPTAALYRAIYKTLWRMNERHDLRSSRGAANDNSRPWSPIGGAA